jgi:AmiR/NasT family two-component response regulator
MGCGAKALEFAIAIVPAIKAMAAKATTHPRAVPRRARIELAKRLCMRQL